MKNAKHTPTIDELLKQLDEEMAWFHGDDFQLDQAHARFMKVKQLASEAEQQLLRMKHDIELLNGDA